MKKQFIADDLQVPIKVIADVTFSNFVEFKKAILDEVGTDESQYRIFNSLPRLSNINLKKCVVFFDVPWEKVIGISILLKNGYTGKIFKISYTAIRDEIGSRKFSEDICEGEARILKLQNMVFKKGIIKKIILWVKNIFYKKGAIVLPSECDIANVFPIHNSTDN